MKKINIPLGGITNVPSDSFSKDGDMGVLINMRHKGGELVTCQPPSTKSNGYADKLMYHAQADTWIKLDCDGNVSWTDKEGTTNLGGKQYDDFTIMGNVVILYGAKPEYAIWRGAVDEGRGNYVFLGERPRVFSVGLKESLKVKESIAVTESMYTAEYDKEKPELYNKVVQKGFIDKALSYVYENCGYVDSVFFRVALKMFDGSYIAVSEVCMMRNRNKYERWVGDNDIKGGASEGYYSAFVDYFIPQLNIPKVDNDWKDLIVSIDVFSTGSMMNWGAKLVIPAVGNQYEEYQDLSEAEIRKNIIDAPFYKVASFDIEGNEIWKIDNTSPSSLAQQESLPDVNMHYYISKNQSSINSRLHSFDGKVRLFNGFPEACCFSYPENETDAYEYYINVYIKTEEGEFVVQKYHEENTSHNPVGAGYHVYPDRRAYKMEIYTNSPVGWTIKTMKLNPHKTRNESIYIALEYEQLTSSQKPSIINNSKAVINETDILRVSAVDNPFYFPTAQTYKFEGSIVGVTTNAEAISTGQFGTYPVFVFTKNGIWAMSVDTSGKGAYVSQVPFSREVCNGDICPVSGGIVFATARGLMAISGGQITELSQPIDGKGDYLIENEELMHHIFAHSSQNLAHGYENGLFRMVPIREFMQGAKLAYNYLHNEVLVSRTDLGYSYVYSLDSHKWSAIETTFDVTTNYYPELVVQNNSKQEKYIFDDKIEEQVGIVAITRPIKVETLDFKRLRQAALRCVFEGDLKFFVLGSNDGATFALLTGKIRNDSGRDLVTAMSRSKQYKYIVIAIAGETVSRLSLVEMLVEGSFASNQLR